MAMPPPCTDVITVEIYDPAKSSWSVGPNLPSGLEQGAAVVVNGTLFVAAYWQVLGGDIVADETATWALTKGAWQQKAAPPAPNCTFAAVGAHLYCIANQAVSAYSTSSDTWSSAH
jgi:hypothetical protein